MPHDGEAVINSDQIVERQPKAGSLRERSRELTRNLVIEAYAELSLERGFNNFTMQDIADRAGISHRTLYRYFEHREAIIDALNAEVAEKVYGPESRVSLAPGELLRHNYRVFGQYRKAMLVSSLMVEMGMMESPGRQARTRHVRQIVDEAAPLLNELGRRQLVGVIRVVAGAMAWARLTSQEFGLSDEDAGAASAWALQTLIEAAATHEGDFS